ncbi:MAG: hypothetical protein GWO20_07915, partial [Candidatus Korarchaeota archaeon]|nr:hypothetical protein [Candidatus Korarchaeota archaeon]NIU83418.1 hypothetical protein [Candidatus Thorarchaeota archaeon]NIW13690.1 hypothetical protein [Candidatus Thorarchaeota archaeon]NIW51789.1 hypothetical protein [Candidatus Korarchaeota archaeon]
MEQEPSNAFLIATFCSIMFVIALLYVTLEILWTINRMLLSHFPELTDPEKIDVFMDYTRPIGYASFLIVITLVVLGFVVDREKISFLGSISLYLPTFGYFVVSMFFFAGIGVLRLLWLPLWDLSPRLLRLGDIAFLPYMIVAFLCWLGGLQLLDLMWVRSYVSFLFVGFGLFLFFLATETWFYGKFKGRPVIDFWIY